MHLVTLQHYMQKLTNLSEIGLIKGKKILVVMPHPDDETGFIGGFIKRASQCNVDVSLVCVTDGAMSTLRYGLKDSDDLKTIRKKELLNACKVLGIKDVEFLDCLDGATREHTKDLKKEIKKIVDNLHPDYLLTYEPDGVYGHPDHIEVSRIVTEIKDEFKDIKLIYVTVPSSFCPDESWQNMAERKINPIEPEYFITLNFKEIICKYLAAKSHKSQFRFQDLKPLFIASNECRFREFIKIV